MKIESHTQADVQVLTVIGSADINSSAALRESLLGAIEAGTKRIVCDLGKLDFICSDALGVLITAYLKANGRGGFVRLANPQAHLKEILETTRLNCLFEVFPDVRCAVGAH